MPVRSRIGHGALYLTAHPERDDLIVEEVEESIWMVLGEITVSGKAMELYRNDLAAALLDWNVDDDEDMH